MAEDLLTALEITVVGMSLVFGSILLLWIVMAALVRLTADREPVRLDPETGFSVDELELKRRAAIAAVAAALAHETEAQPHAFPLPPTAIVSAWQAVNRGRQLKQRGPAR